MQSITDIYIRDPFILPWQGRYYLYAAQYPTFVVRTSTDLTNWSEPRVIFERTSGRTAISGHRNATCTPIPQAA